MKILLVEDDTPLAQGLKQSLKREKHVVDWVSSGNKAIASVYPEETDMVILDLGLPDIDGIQVLKSIKSRYPQIPVLILTARGGIESKVEGLDLGADDYLPKPFNMEELFARMRVIERRLGTGATSVIEVGEVVLDTKANLIFSNGTEIKLSSKEYMIARTLIENAGRIQSKANLESKLYEWGEEVSSNTIEVHVHNMRKKLPKGFVQTVRGVGYIVRKPECR
ncbi:DNA-binding response regulator [Alteromonas sediminis]|uniref:DNA-binding response regulator n=1 Tax=Alteromonas sediminis TaxID=2259342 RepID=A0A3N5Z7F5_9ALTE|nr:response regulator transcription factor [Alteromonas sediminis]RPJ66614.1 DNA-binding response regulator [Alteromonas sediminis]